MVVLILVLIIAIAVVGWFIAMQNQIKVYQLKVKEALAGIDVALTKRYDTLTKMVDAVKAFRQHETDLLMEIVKLRTDMSMQERRKASEQMDEVASKIRVIAENYPELKSSNNYVELQKAIVDVEEHLQAARRLYNSNVTAYNAKLVMFPSSLVASMIGAQQAEYFEAEEHKRQDVKIS